MDLNLFENREINNSNNVTVNKFLEELRNELTNFTNRNNIQKNNTIDRYNLYEKKKIFLDNKSRRGNDLAWITDEKSVCISEHGDGGPYFLSETDLPQDVRVGEVYEKVNGTYMYNHELTIELNQIKL